MTNGGNTFTNCIIFILKGEGLIYQQIDFLRTKRANFAINVATPTAPYKF